MLSLKETKPIIGMDTENSLALTSSTQIDANSILNPGQNNNGTISIVIPLSAQLSTITSRVVEPQCKNRNGQENQVIATQLNLDSQQTRREDGNQVVVQSVSRSVSHEPSLVASIKGKDLESWLTGIRADKTKGCPISTCSRYGRAFSRAHDLKRHIARHATRKDRCIETGRVDCPQCGETFANDAILQKHARIHADTLGNVEIQSPATNLESVRVYSRNSCKKKCPNEKKLKTHVIAHEKKSESSVCPLCNCQFDQEDALQIHMRDHTSSITQPDFSDKVTDKSTQAKDDDDDFMLEEMLLLNKNPRLNGTNGRSQNAASSSIAASSTSTSSSSTNSNKIRCDYCSKTFKTKWTLSSHVAAHEGRFQFGCTRCGKKFVRKSHFEGHVRSHEAARPYVCEQCGKTFKELKHRREHTKRKHPGNRNAIQNLLDSISACVSEESTVEQAKFTLLMPINFNA